MSLKALPQPPTPNSRPRHRPPPICRRIERHPVRRRHTRAPEHGVRQADTRALKRRARRVVRHVERLGGRGDGEVRVLVCWADAGVLILMMVVVVVVGVDVEAGSVGVVILRGVDMSIGAVGRPILSANDMRSVNLGVLDQSRERRNGKSISESATLVSKHVLLYRSGMRETYHSQDRTRDGVRQTHVQQEASWLLHAKIPLRMVANDAQGLRSSTARRGPLLVAWSGMICGLHLLGSRFKKLEGRGS